MADEILFSGEPQERDICENLHRYLFFGKYISGILSYVKKKIHKNQKRCFPKSKVVL